MPSLTMPRDVGLQPDLAGTVAAMLGAPVLEAVQLSGGRNALVWRIATSRGRFALKSYPPVGVDGRDRLATEITAVEFARRHHIADLPELIACDHDRRLAIYRWIEGGAAQPAAAGDIDACIALARALHAARGEDEAAALPLASEACLSAAELVAQIERRSTRLQSVTDGGDVFAALVGDVMPARLASCRAEMHRLWSAHGWDPAVPLPAARATLSLSDFGLHNAVRQPDGRLVFLDLEYFGWDDPVKLVADFLLHPGMMLDRALRGRFLAQARELYGADADFEPRLRGLAPLYRLRWSLILLNEFLPERLALRRASGMLADRADILASQLAKAQAMLANPVPEELVSL